MVSAAAKWTHTFGKRLAWMLKVRKAPKSIHIAFFPFSFVLLHYSTVCVVYKRVEPKKKKKAEKPFTYSWSRSRFDHGKEMDLNNKEDLHALNWLEEEPTELNIRRTPRSNAV